MPGLSCLPAKQAHLNSLPVTNLPGLSVRPNRGEARGRTSYGTSRVLAAAAASEGSEGAQATYTIKKQEKNGVPAKRESSSMQAARGPSRPIGSSRPIARSLGGFNDLLPSVSLRQMLDAMDLVAAVLGDPILTPMDVSNQHVRETVRTPWDVREEENAYLLRVDIPVYSKEQVKVYVEEGYFVIKAGQGSEDKGDKDKGDKDKGDKSEDKGDESGCRNYGTFISRVLLPENVDVEKISAELKNGVLIVRLPKVEKASRKEVMEIQVQSNA